MVFNFGHKKEFREWYDLLSLGHIIVAEGINAKQAVELSPDIENDYRFAQLIRGEVD